MRNRHLTYQRKLQVYKCLSEALEFARLILSQILQTIVSSSQANRDRRIGPQSCFDNDIVGLITSEGLLNM